MGQFTNRRKVIFWEQLILFFASFLCNEMGPLQVNNHFTDFELDSDMMELLDGFESRLESAKMQVFPSRSIFCEQVVTTNI